MVTATWVKSVKKCYVIETRLMCLKTRKTLTASRKGKGKIWVLVQKWAWGLKSVGKKNKQVNVAIPPSSTITTKHHKRLCLLFLFFWRKINGKRLSISKSHYLPQETEMVMVCLFIVISNYSCVLADVGISKLFLCGVSSSRLFGVQFNSQFVCFMQACISAWNYSHSFSACLPDTLPYVESHLTNIRR